MIRRDIQHDPDLRASFNALARATFDIDFEAWYLGGFWDDSYACHAWVENGQVLATVGATDMELRIAGEPCAALQIGTVMTHPDHRGRGLSSRLMDEVLAGAERAFLFANPKAQDYYPRFGFRRVRECEFWMDVGPPEPEPLPWRPLRLEQAEDLALLSCMARIRVPVSKRLSIQAPSLLLWYALNPLRKAFFHIPEEDLILAGCRKGATFHLYDVIAKHLPPWERLRCCLPLEGAETLVFHFTPDLLVPQAKWRQAGDDDLLFVRGDLDFGDGPFRFPFTAQA